MKKYLLQQTLENSMFERLVCYETTILELRSGKGLYRLRCPQEIQSNNAQNMSINRSLSQHIYKEKSESGRTGAVLVPSTW